MGAMGPGPWTTVTNPPSTTPVAVEPCGPAEHAGAGADDAHHFPCAAPVCGVARARRLSLRRNTCHSDDARVQSPAVHLLHGPRTGKQQQQQLLVTSVQ